MTYYIAFMFALPFLEWLEEFRVIIHRMRLWKPHCYISRTTLNSRQLIAGHSYFKIVIGVKFPVWISRLIAKPGQHDFDISTFRGASEVNKTVEFEINGVNTRGYICDDMAFMRCRFCGKEYGQTGGQLYLSFEHFDSDYPCQGFGGAHSSCH
jgi:hypothetical protein